MESCSILWPSSGLIPTGPCLFCTGDPRAGCNIPDWSQQSREVESPPLTCWPCYFSCSSGSRLFSGLWVHIAGFYPSFHPPLSHRSFFLSLYWYWGLPWPRWRTLRLALLNFLGFPWPCSSSLAESLWMSSLPLSIINCITQLGAICKLAEWLKAPHSPTGNVINEDNECTGPTTGTGGTPLTTGFHLDTNPLTTALWMQAFCQFLIHPAVHSLNWYHLSLELRLLWGTVSKALQKSR